MASITTINSGDLITDSRADINNNFDNLNTDKIETSVIDTDTTLAADSDAKLPSQKAVKAYVDAGGNVNASTTARGIVEVATDAEVTAGTATGTTGASLTISPETLATRLTTLLADYQNKTHASGQTTYDVSTASGTQNIAHGLGRTPTKVNLSGFFLDGTSRISVTIGAFTASGNSCIYYATKNIATVDNSAGGSSTQAIYFNDPYGSAGSQVGVVTVDGTNIIITWTKTGSISGTSYIQWDAS